MESGSGDDDEEGCLDHHYDYFNFQLPPNFYLNLETKIAYILYYPFQKEKDNSWFVSVKEVSISNPATLPKEVAIFDLIVEVI